MKSPEDAAQEIVDKMSPFMDHFKAIQDQAEAMGIFIEDRGLIKCPNCFLMEDIDFTGRLLTFIEPAVFREDHSDITKPFPPEYSTFKAVDSGMRFEEIEEDKFKCPNCGAICKPEEPEFDDDW